MNMYLNPSVRGSIFMEVKKFTREGVEKINHNVQRRDCLLNT
jgi:hypothetical protein